MLAGDKGGCADTMVAAAQSFKLQALALKCIGLGHGDIHSLSQESRAVLGLGPQRPPQSAAGQAPTVQISTALKCGR